MSEADPYRINSSAEDALARAIEVIARGAMLIAAQEKDLNGAAKVIANAFKRAAADDERIANLIQERDEAFNAGLATAASIVNERRFSGDRDLRSIAAAILAASIIQQRQSAEGKSND